MLGSGIQRPYANCLSRFYSNVVDCPIAIAGGSRWRGVNLAGSEVCFCFTLNRMTATAASWKCEPFREGAPISYRAVFNAEELARLKTGLIPRQMEDKWFIYYDEPHLFLHRSWTGQAVYRLTLKSLPEGAEVTETLWSKELAAVTWEAEYQVQLLDFLLSNLMLGQSKPFPMPPDVDEPRYGVLQHHISGTGYRQSQAKPKRS